MPKRKAKSVRFDALVKWFIKNYDIPTKTDIDRLMARIDQLEKLIKTHLISGRGVRSAGSGSRRAATTATGVVLDAVKNARNPVGVKDIQNITGYDEKKLRNIIFRLNKLDKIKRAGRGVYVAV